MDWSDGPFEGKDIGDRGEFLNQYADGIPLPEPMQYLTD